MTYESVKSAEPAQSAPKCFQFAIKTNRAEIGLSRGDQPDFFELHRLFRRE